MKCDAVYNVLILTCREPEGNKGCAVQTHSNASSALKTISSAQYVKFQISAKYVKFSLSSAQSQTSQMFSSPTIFLLSSRYVAPDNLEQKGLKLEF